MLWDYGLKIRRRYGSSKIKVEEEGYEKVTNRLVGKYELSEGSAHFR